LRSRIVVLNYNRRGLLAECLPSIVAAAAAATDRTRVSVVDNSSTDGSVEYLRREWPEVEVFQEPNRGLVSYNAVLGRVAEPVVFLLNNDVKLDAGFVDPLVAVFERDPECFLAGPLCWRFDGTTYEGMRTHVRIHRGLVQASVRFPGYERSIHEPGFTAAVGPVLAVDREKFLALGGYDSLYLPGRLEDLDLGYRAWLAGWKAYYVPEAVAYHKGFGTFHDAYGVEGCDLLALRNTLLFMWKNIRDARHLVRHLAALPCRAAHSVLSALWVPRQRRFLFLRALFAAIPRLPAAVARGGVASRLTAGMAGAQPNVASARRQRRQEVRFASLGDRTAAERAFFARFRW